MIYSVSHGWDERHGGVPTYPWEDISSSFKTKVKKSKWLFLIYNCLMQEIFDYWIIRIKNLQTKKKITYELDMWIILRPNFSWSKILGAQISQGPNFMGTKEVRSPNEIWDHFSYVQPILRFLSRIPHLPP